MKPAWDDWPDWSDPTRHQMIKMEPLMGEGFVPHINGRIVRGKWESCPGCQAAWSEFCEADCRLSSDPWNPEHNDRVRRYFD